MSGIQSISIGPVAAAVAGHTQGVGGVAADQRLLERVWTDQSPRLARLAAVLGLRSDQAADVLQDVYVTALRFVAQRQPPIADETGLVRWLFRVTANRCHLEHRRGRRWRRAWQSLTGVWRADGNAARLPSGELRREVDQALATLEPEDRLLVALRYFMNLNSRQIAEIVDEPESTVRGRLRIARMRLAEKLAEWHED
jgi:RNA polymerase sigma-70 factor (ECF subfamily)